MVISYDDCYSSNYPSNQYYIRVLGFNFTILLYSIESECRISSDLNVRDPM